MATQASTRNKALDKFDQAADGSEDRPIDLVVGNTDTKTLFDSRDYRHHGHRIEFGDASQQGGIGIEPESTPFQAEYVVQQMEKFFLSIQIRSPQEKSLPHN